MLMSVMTWQPEVKSTVRSLVPNTKVSSIQLALPLESTLKPVARGSAIVISLVAEKTLVTSHKVLR